MRLRECLTQVPSGMLRKMAARYGLPYVGEYVPDIRDSLIKYFLSPSTLHPLLESLADVESTALGLLALSDEDGLHRVRCHRQLRTLTGLSHEESRRQYVRLLRRGLVFQVKRGWEELYLVPNDLRRFVRTWTLEKLARKASVCERETIEARRVPPDLLVRQAHWFLAACKKGQPRITQQGRIYKRDQEDLFRHLGWPLPAVEASFFTLDNRHLEPVQYLLSYFEWYGVIDGLDSRLRVRSRLDAWLAWEPAEKHASMVDYLYEYYMNSEAIQLVLDSLELAGGSWVEWRKLVESLAGYTVDAPARARLLSLVKDDTSGFWLSPLPLAAGLGLVEVGVIEDSRAENGSTTENARPQRLALRWSTAQPVAEEGFASDFYVQPTFEVLVPLTADYWLLWNLELVADLEKIDLMCQYRLSRESVYRALEWGLEGQELLGFLEDGARNELPQNVAFSLESWMEKYGGIRFTEGILVHCADQEAAETFRSLAPVREGRAIVVGPQYFLIAPDDHEQIVDALRQAGQLPSTSVRSLAGGQSGSDRARMHPDSSMEEAAMELAELDSTTVPKPRYLPLYRWHHSNLGRLAGIPRRGPFTMDDPPDQ